MAKYKGKREAAEKKQADPDVIDHGTLIKWVDESDQGTIETRRMAEKSLAYYAGDQWTDAEKKKLASQKQSAVVVNRVKPKIDGLFGMERSNRTTAKAYPRTPQHEKASSAATEAVRFVLQDNSYNQIRSMMFDNLCLPGTGGCEVQVSEKKDGKLKIKVNWISWDRIIYDPRSRRKDFADARYLGQYIWLDYDIALEEFPDGLGVLSTMIEGSSTYDDKPTWLDTQRKRVKVVELYFIQGGDVFYTCFTRGGMLKDIKKSPFVNEEGETEWPYEYGSLNVTTEGDRYGAAWQYLDVQDEINKRRSKALHLMSVRQVMSERGAVEDVNKARAELARPDGFVEVTPGMLFEVLKTGDMAQAQFNLLAEAKAEIDAVGYSAAASGKETRNMSGVALRNREAASQTELAPLFDVLKHLDVRVYRKIWNRIKQYWKDEIWIRVTDDPANLRWVGLNAPITKGQQALEQAQASGMPPEQLQMLQQQIAQDPMASEVVDTSNDVAELDVDIVMDDAPDSVTMQQEEFTALAEMVKSGIPIPPQAIIKASSLKDKEQILKDMQQSQVNPEAVQKMQEEMQKLKEENQLLKSDQQVEAAKLQQKAQADQVKMAAESAKQAEEMKLERERVEAEIQLMREKAAAEMALERAKLQAELALEKVKIEGQAQVEGEKIKLEQKKQSDDATFKRSEQAKKDEAPMLESVLPNMTKFMEKHSAAFEKSMKEVTGMVEKATAAKPKGKRKFKAIYENGRLAGVESDG